MSNEIKPFGSYIPENSIATDLEYEISKFRTQGLEEGLESKELMNKFFRQSSRLSYCLSEYLKLKVGVGLTDTESILSFEKKMDALLESLSDVIEVTGITTTIRLDEPIGHRSLQPWEYPKPGYRVMNGSFIELDDPQYSTVRTYLQNNPYELISSVEWEAKSTMPVPNGPGGIGGVHFYAIYPNGRIRLPDTRGDLWEASGFMGRKPLEYRVGIIGTTPTTDTSWGRSVSYLPVVYFGEGVQLVVSEGKLVMAGSEGKHIGEVFLYEGNVAPGGALHLDGALLPRSLYFALFDNAESTGRVITEAEWQTTYLARGFVDKYSSGDGSTTFRLPIYDTNSRNWVTEGIWCVHAYSSVVMEGSLDYKQFIEDVAIKIIKMIDANNERSKVATFAIKIN
jgi:hypothetical protein